MIRLVPSVNAEEVQGRGNVGLCNSGGRRGELIYPAAFSASTGAVGKNRSVYRNLVDFDTRGDLIKLTVRQLYRIFGIRRANRNQQRSRGQQTKKLTTHRTLHNE